MFDEGKLPFECQTLDLDATQQARCEFFLYGGTEIIDSTSDDST